MKHQTFEQVRQEYRERHSYPVADNGARAVSHPALEIAALKEITDAREIMLQITRVTTAEQARQLAAAYLSVVREAA